MVNMNREKCVHLIAKINVEANAVIEVINIDFTEDLTLSLKILVGIFISNAKVGSRYLPALTTTNMVNIL